MTTDKVPLLSAEDAYDFLSCMPTDAPEPELRAIADGRAIVRPTNDPRLSVTVEGFEQMRRDAHRLDWLEVNGLFIALDASIDSIGVDRSSIDAAIKDLCISSLESAAGLDAAIALSKIKYQRREIGESDWKNCSIEQYRHAQTDPHLDTRIDTAIAAQKEQK